jgi:lipoprotein NlpD
LRRACALCLVALLAGCASRSPAPVEDRRARPAKPAAKAAAAKPAPAAPAQREGTYTVKRGDTLYSIALEHGADYREVAQWNALDDPTKLNVGQVLRVTPPEERRVEVGKVRGGTILGRVESRPLDPVPQKEAAPSAAKPPPPSPAPQAAAAEFIWPVKGKVLAGFSEPRKRGIDIDGKPGDPVVAAASGRVTYVGSGIPGLGKLVVIKHDSGFITVYAHNRDIVVKEQQAVARGQKIAALGSTDSDRPKLHFQIRKGAAAVDPLRYLPAL